MIRALEKAFGMREGGRRLPAPVPPERGPFRRDFWKSPLRGAWLSSVLSAALLPLIVVCAVTGLLSHVAYDTELAGNSVTGSDGLLSPIYGGLDWPAGWPWLYALNQGLHVVAGVAAIPILLAKLWSVIPKLWERPAVRTAGHAVERLSLMLLVGSGLFVFFTGVLNIQIYYPWQFSFVPSHLYGAFIFLAALAFHIVVKLPTMARAFRERGVVRPLRESAAETTVEPVESSESVATAPRAATISRRGLLGAVGAASVGLGAMMAGQAVGGPLRGLAFLAPRGVDTGVGPNDFPVNKTAASVGVTPEQTAAAWRLNVVGRFELSLTRDALLRLPQSSQRLPIACVEGWSTTQEWSGVPIVELAGMAGVGELASVFVESLQEGGAFGQTTLNAAQATDTSSLLALTVNGADLSLDHGFPARLIVPALPGVHNTKWVERLTFQSA